MGSFDKRDATFDLPYRVRIIRDRNLVHVTQIEPGTGNLGRDSKTMVLVSGVPQSPSKENWRKNRPTYFRSTAVNRR
jgi:hypothetical protein